MDFAKISPADLRARVLLNGDLSLDAESRGLSLELVADQDQVDAYEFPLEIEGTGIQRSGSLRGTMGYYTILRLSEAGQEELARLQFEVGSVQERYKGLGISLAFGFQEAEDVPDSIKLSILLRLRPEQDYFALLDGQEMRVNRESDGDSPPEIK